MSAPIRAVIFDFDGLVVDTESTGYLTWREIFQVHGHDLPVERYAQVVGTDFSTSYDPRRDLESLTGREFDWEAQEVLRRARETELRHTLQTLPGVVDRLQEDSLNGLKAARAAGMRCIVVPGPMTRHLDFEGAWKRVQSLTEVSLSEFI
jgi:putative hydrolase of the HAD superfamily